jgi:CcmD family protein
MAFHRVLIALTSLYLVSCAMLASLSASALAWQPPAGQSEFVPVETLPPGDQLPAAPLLITAYAFVWLAVMFYLWTISRRLNAVETEMRALAQKTAQR